MRQKHLCIYLYLICWSRSSLTVRLAKWQSTDSTNIRVQANLTTTRQWLTLPDITGHWHTSPDKGWTPLNCSLVLMCKWCSVWCCMWWCVWWCVDALITWLSGQCHYNAIKFGQQLNLFLNLEPYLESLWYLLSNFLCPPFPVALARNPITFGDVFECLHTRRE